MGHLGAPAGAFFWGVDMQNGRDCSRPSWLSRLTASTKTAAVGACAGAKTATCRGGDGTTGRAGAGCAAGRRAAVGRCGSGGGGTAAIHAAGTAPIAAITVVMVAAARAAAGGTPLRTGLCAPHLRTFRCAELPDLGRWLGTRRGGRLAFPTADERHGGEANGGKLY